MEGEQPVGTFAFYLEESESLVKPDGQCRAVLKIQPKGAIFFWQERVMFW